MFSEQEMVTVVSDEGNLVFEEDIEAYKEKTQEFTDVNSHVRLVVPVLTIPARSYWKILFSICLVASG